MPTWVLPQNVVEEVSAEANRLGRRAFDHKGHPHYWSGPDRNVWALIAGDKEWNEDRAVTWAEAHGAMVLEKTNIGKFLDAYEGLGIDVYFDKNHLVPGLKEKSDAARMVWAHASHLFALSSHGTVTTTVCGAYRGGVWYSLEMPNVLEPTYSGLNVTDFLKALSSPHKEEVVTINLTPFKKILEAKKVDGVEAAHMKICLSEQRMSLHEALEHSTRKAIREALTLASAEVLKAPGDAYKYFLESQERFLVDRALQMKGTKFADDFLANKTPEVRRQKREDKLFDFCQKLLAVINAEVLLMDPADRPTFIVPSYAMRPCPK